MSESVAQSILASAVILGILILLLTTIRGGVSSFVLELVEAIIKIGAILAVCVAIGSAVKTAFD